MAAGTLSVTNNSKAVVGVDTTFTAFKAGDFLTLVVGQVPYTVAIASVESDTALTLVLPFDGPTATGLAWDGVARDTMSLATMGVTVQAQKAMRLMIADENNWRAIFGDEEEVTVTLPNGQVMQGMSWGYLSRLLKEVDPVEMRNLQQQAAASEAAAQGFRNEAEGFKTETAGIRDATNQIKTDTQAIHDATNTIKTQTDQIKTDTQAIKDLTNQIKTETGVIRDEANTAKTDAQAASAAAQGFRDQAEEWAQSVNPDNLLTKSGNLAGMVDPAEARSNLNLGSVATENTVPVGKGGTGATNADDARSHLGLGSAATRNTGNNSGDVMEVGAFGLGRPDGAYVFNTTSQDAILASLETNGLCVFRNNQQIAAPWDIWNYSSNLFFRAGDTYSMISIPFEQAGKIKVFGGAAGFGWKTARTIYDTENTTVDSNGFLKTASPIVKVFKDGSFETNEQSKGATVERVSIGVYKISGVLGLNSEAVWGGAGGGFEIPVDVNKQARIWLDYEVNADGSIVMKTYHRTHDSSPSFATNTIDGFNNGDPIDIPSDAFVSVRVNMP